MGKAMMQNDITPSAPCRIVGCHGHNLIFLHSYPQHVELRIGEETRSFPDRDRAMMFLKTFLRKKQKPNSTNGR